MMKRVLCAALILVLVPCLALADFTMAGYDDENTYRAWGSNLFFQRMEERTGVKFTYRQYTKESDWQQFKQDMLAGTAELPDVLFKADLSGTECLTLLQKGVLVDLAPYLAECCPHLSALLEAHPEYREAITLPGGGIAALPAIHQRPSESVIWLNQDWLNTLGLSMPTTAEEFAEVLRAFKNSDPNRNGKQDEIPMAFLGAFDLKFLGHAFGLTANDYNLRAVDGQAEFVPLDPAFRDFVTWLRQLFAEGLLDPQGFVTTDSLRTVTNENNTRVYGGAIAPLLTSFLPASWMSSYAVMPPLSYQGQTVYRSFIGPVLGGTFAITSACGDVPALLRWVDEFYTEEVYLLASAGQENVDYVVDGDGTWRLTANASGNTYFSGQTLLSSGTAYPCYATEDFQRRYTDGSVARLSKELEKVTAVARRPFPYYTLTEEQAAAVAPLQNALGRLVDEQMARWVLGEDEITDDSFAAFEQALRDAGLEQFMTFWQSVLTGRNEG